MRTPLFLHLETTSACNRRCPTCLRNSHPDREAVASWFTPTLMPMEVIQEALTQYAALRPGGVVSLHFYNEPLLDPRIHEIVELVRSTGSLRVYFATNGDALTPEMAQRLDGEVGTLIISLYDRKGRGERNKWIRSLFQKTGLIFKHRHATTHCNTSAPVHAARFVDAPCLRARKRLLINHRGDLCMCCEDMAGNFGFGRFPETSLAEYWNGAKHEDVVRTLCTPGGRRAYPYCAACPRECAA